MNTQVRLSISRQMRTTIIAARKPTDFESLDRHFLLIRYELPSKFKWNQDESKYARLHNQIKNQLGQPYKTYENDRLEGGDKNKCVIYILYRRGEQPIALKYILGTQEYVLKPQIISFGQIAFHMTIKLLQADYFRGERQPSFVNQGKCVIVARVFAHSLTALEIELKGDRHNQDSDEIQYFTVIGSAQRYIHTKKSNADFQINPTSAYFIKRTTVNGTTLSQVQPDKVAETKDELFFHYTKSKKRVSLPYHDLRNLTSCRGWLLQDFINNFIEYLEAIGIQAEQVIRSFTKYGLSQNETNLSLHHLGKVDIFDNRLEKNNPLFDEFMNILLDEFRKDKLQFRQCSELSNGSTTPTLILQDYGREDFEAENDPKWVIYENAAYSRIPKQSFDIRNRRHQQEESSDDETENDDASGIDPRRNLRVALTQLLLKKIIIESQYMSDSLPVVTTTDAVGSLIGRLPLFANVKNRVVNLGNFAYVRRKTISGDSDFTLLYIEGDKLCFVDLNNGTQPLATICEEFGYKWDRVWTELHRIHYRLNEAGVIKKELPTFDLILSPHQAIEIEYTNEIVLYDYAVIKKRRDAIHKQHSIDEFRRLKAYPTKNAAMKKNIEDFMGVLDFIELDHATISFKELTQSKFVEQIAGIFGLKKNEKQEYQFGKLKRLYQHKRIGMFESDKGTELHTYSGIWYDSESRYLVGEPQGMKPSGQPKANPIRQFTVLIGSPEVEVELWLAAMSVLFIRYQRFTVLPYPFKLIDMYNDLQKLR